MRPNFFLACFFALTACSSSDGAPVGEDSGAADTTAPSDTADKPDTTVGTDAPPTDTGAPPSDTGTPSSDTGPVTCKTSTVKSSCGANGVVSVVVKLGAGMPDAVGPVIVNLNHLRLGSGSTGGVVHTGTKTASTTVSAAGGVDVAFDFCAGGQMWSEENCEFNLFGYVDKNGNGALDPGEPAGRTVVSISCRGKPTCAALVLDCTTGTACTTFTDPGGCKCAIPGCASALKTCS